MDGLTEIAIYRVAFAAENKARVKIFVYFIAPHIKLLLFLVTNFLLLPGSFIIEYFIRLKWENVS